MAHLFVEQLTVLDCAYLCAQRGVVGESWIVDLELIGELDEQGMVLDFGAVKRQLRDAMEAVADHRLLVPAQAAELNIRQQTNAAVALDFESQRGRISHRSPAAAVCLLDAPAVDTATLTTALLAAARRAVPTNVQDIRIALRHEAIDGAWYRYTHGLRMHDGLCQRIAHGHRSRLQILIDGQRAPQAEAAQASRWADIYLGNRADLVESSDQRYHFAYTAAEGEFEISLPMTHCELLDTETTVEQIAAHLQRQLREQYPQCTLQVRAYEGVNKGALSA